jgi:hypothetical protein
MLVPLPTFRSPPIYSVRPQSEVRQEMKTYLCSSREPLNHRQLMFRALCPCVVFLPCIRTLQMYGYMTGIPHMVQIFGVSETISVAGRDSERGPRHGPGLALSAEA